MKNVEINSLAPPKGNRRKIDLPDRLLEFAAKTIELACEFVKSIPGNHISTQLVRSVTSIGANYEEACAAQSRPDFIHKLQVALKESRETVYWLKLAERLDLTTKQNLDPIKREAEQLLLIPAKSVVTSKGLSS